MEEKTTENNHLDTYKLTCINIFSYLGSHSGSGRLLHYANLGS